MVEQFTCVLFCRKCHALRKAYEGYREKRVMPEAHPRLDVVTLCCSICGEPFMEVTAVSGKGAK